MRISGKRENPSNPNSLSLHPNRRHVAKGQVGKDPFVCIWDSVTMETVSILQGGHERGITSLGFSSDGEVGQYSISHS